MFPLRFFSLCLCLCHVALLVLPSRGNKPLRHFVMVTPDRVNQSADCRSNSSDNDLEFYRKMCSAAVNVDCTECSADVCEKPCSAYVENKLGRHRRGIRNDVQLCLQWKHEQTCLCGIHSHLEPIFVLPASSEVITKSCYNDTGCFSAQQKRSPEGNFVEYCHKLADWLVEIRGDHVTGLTTDIFQCETCGKWRDPKMDCEAYCSKRYAHCAGLKMHAHCVTYTLGHYHREPVGDRYHLFYSYYHGTHCLCESAIEQEWNVHIPASKTSMDWLLPAHNADWLG